MPLAAHSRSLSQLHVDMLRGQSLFVHADSSAPIDHFAYLESLRGIDPTSIFIQHLEENLTNALERGDTVRSRANHLVVPPPRRGSRKKWAALNADLGALRAQRDLDMKLASSGQISEQELRSRERKRAALGCPKDVFAVLNYVRFVGEVGLSLRTWSRSLLLNSFFLVFDSSTKSKLSRSRLSKPGSCGYSLILSSPACLRFMSSRLAVHFSSPSAKLSSERHTSICSLKSSPGGARKIGRSSRAGYGRRVLRSAAAKRGVIKRPRITGYACRHSRYAKKEALFNAAVADRRTSTCAIQETMRGGRCRAYLVMMTGGRGVIDVIRQAPITLRPAVLPRPRLLRRHLPRRLPLPLSLPRVSLSRLRR